MHHMIKKLTPIGMLSGVIYMYEHMFYTIAYISYII